MSPPDMRNAGPRQGPRRQVIAAHGFTHSKYASRRPERQGPSTFGLTPLELWHEAARLVCDYGWDLDEVRELLALPEAAA